LQTNLGGGRLEGNREEGGGRSDKEGKNRKLYFANFVMPNSPPTIPKKNPLDFDE